jgi:DNA-binding HxlR family transcriptional regulator
MENGVVREGHSKAACSAYLRAVHDSLDVLGGKWKISIIGALTFGNRRFKELQREVTGITAKMLSKELKELEMNQLVKRTVYDSKPVTVEYELTSYGKSLEDVLKALMVWGTQHRKRIMTKKQPA